MLSYIGRRLIMMAPVILGVIVLTFLILHLSPGDPALLLAGDQAPPEVVEQLRREYGLDKPLWQQFFSYLGKLAKLDLGRSIRSRVPVSEEIGRCIAATLELVVVAELWALLIGIPMGVIAAVQRGKFIDKFTMVMAACGISAPIFVLGLLLIYLFSLTLGLFPMSGRGGPIWTLAGLKHIMLPAITLGSYHVAAIARVMRSSLLEVLREDYIRTAKAKGLPNRLVIYKHALRNALLPVITVFGYNAAHAIGGAVVVETVFGWPGVGRMVWMAIINADYPLIQGALLVFGIAFTFVNLAIDIVYKFIDPRVSFD